MKYLDCFRFLITLVLSLGSIGIAFADGIVGSVTSAPIYPNGIVVDERSGLNINLQNDQNPGFLFMNPEVRGYGLPPGGSMEIELVSGFQRDPNVPLDGSSLLLTSGTPQQGLPGRLSGFEVLEGKNDKTFLIKVTNPTGVLPEETLSAAEGAAQDPIPQKGIKIIHIGRNHAFVSRGEKGVVSVRILDSGQNVIASGTGEVTFLREPRPQVFPTNITHKQRNHNWQRVKVGQIVGVANNTLPIPLLMYERNDGLERNGILGAGVLSAQALSDIGYAMPPELARYTGGLILQDQDGNGFLNPAVDKIIGGIIDQSPQGAVGHQVVTPLVQEKPFLSRPSGDFNPKAGRAFGGALMQVVYIAGNVPGLYRPTFALLERPGDITSLDGSKYTYTVVVEPSPN
ncbi:MAG: hypothetical protein AAGF54_15495 [Pseudomonadota bacterium]